MVAPLTRPTSTKLRFTWLEEAEQVFKHVKTLFTAAVILAQPDPVKQFVLVVDASDTGVGAVLSWHAAPDQRLLP